MQYITLIDLHVSENACISGIEWQVLKMIFLLMFQKKTMPVSYKTKDSLAIWPNNCLPTYLTTSFKIWYL